MTTTADTDLSFSVEVDGRTMTGTLVGSGSDLELRVSDPWLSGGSGTAAACAVAEQLAASGLRLTVVADRPWAVPGERRTSYLQRRVTGSPHIRVPSFAAAVRLARLRRRPVSRTLAPPTTSLPLVPTLLRRPRRPTTTHDPDRGGYPRPEAGARRSVRIPGVQRHDGVASAGGRSPAEARGRGQSRSSVAWSGSPSKYSSSTRR